MDREAFEHLFDMTGRTVIVTGGTRGIGLALAEGFVLAGARVVVASRKPDACEEAAQHLRELGGQVIGVPTHLGDVDDLAALVQRTVDEFGGIDVVVNSAANALAQPLGEMTVDAWTKSYEVNLRGPVCRLHGRRDADEAAGLARRNGRCRIAVDVGRRQLHHRAGHHC